VFVCWFVCLFIKVYIVRWWRPHRMSNVPRIQTS